MEHKYVLSFLEAILCWPIRAFKKDFIANMIQLLQGVMSS